MKSLLAFWMGGAASPTAPAAAATPVRFMGAAGLFLTPSKRKFRKFAKWKPKRRER